MKNTLLLVHDVLRERQWDVSFNRYRARRELRRSETISYVPETFSLSITFRCNLRCPTCQYLLNDPQAFDKMGFMPLELYQSILDKYGRYMKWVNFSGGEPTLHPRFEEFVDIAKSRRLRIGVPTNGILVKRKLEAFKKIDKINISCDGYDASSYNRARAGTERHWGSILEGIRLLKENQVSFNLSFVLSDANIDELPQIIDFADRIEPAVLNLHSLNPQADDASMVLKGRDPRVLGVLRAVMERTDYRYHIKMPTLFDEQSESFKKSVCPLPWEQVYINENGSIAYCCHLAHDDAIGNFHEGYEFNSAVMQEWRRSLVDGSFGKDCKFCERRFLRKEIVFDRVSQQWRGGSGLSTVGSKHT